MEPSNLIDGYINAINSALANENEANIIAVFPPRSLFSDSDKYISFMENIINEKIIKGQIDVYKELTNDEDDSEELKKIDEQIAMFNRIIVYIDKLISEENMRQQKEDEEYLNSNEENDQNKIIFLECIKSSLMNDLKQFERDGKRMEGLRKLFGIASSRKQLDMALSNHIKGKRIFSDDFNNVIEIKGTGHRSRIWTEISFIYSWK